MKGLIATGVAALLLALVPALSGAQGATLAPPFEGDFVIRDFHFASGESL